jgi:hypothetical protein
MSMVERRPSVLTIAIVLAAMMVAIVSPAALEAPTPCTANCAGGATLPNADAVPDRPASQAAPPGDPAVQASMPGCAVWTDTCVVCTRDAGKVTCSNIGTACQPQALQCLRAEGAQESKPEEKKPEEKKPDK